MSAPEVLTGQGKKVSAARVLVLGVAIVVFAAWLGVGVGLAFGAWDWDRWAGFMGFGRDAFLGSAGAFALNEIGSGLAGRT